MVSMLMKQQIPSVLLLSNAGLWHNSWPSPACMEVFHSDEWLFRYVQEILTGISSSRGSFTKVHATQCAWTQPRMERWLAAQQFRDRELRAVCPSHLSWRNLPGSRQDLRAIPLAFCIACNVVIQKPHLLTRSSTRCLSQRRNNVRHTVSIFRGTLLRPFLVSTNAAIISFFFYRWNISLTTWPRPPAFTVTVHCNFYGEKGNDLLNISHCCLCGGSCGQALPYLLLTGIE